MHYYYYAAAKEGARRNHTSQAERRSYTSSTLPRISSLPKDAHLLPHQQQQQHRHQFVVTKGDRYLRRTRSTPQEQCAELYEDTEEGEITLSSPIRNVHTYPVGLSGLAGEEHHNLPPPPPPSQVTTAWQQTAKKTLSKTKTKIHRVLSGLTMRAAPVTSTNSQDIVDYDVEEVGSERGKRKLSPAGSAGDTNPPRLPSLYSNTQTPQHGSPQKRVYGLSNR